MGLRVWGLGVGGWGFGVGGDQGTLVSMLSRSERETRSPTIVWSMSKTTSKFSARCLRCIRMGYAFEVRVSPSRSRVEG